MTQRERGMLTVLVALAGIIGVAGLAYIFFLRPLSELNRDEETALDAINKKDAMVKALIRDRAQLKIAKERSLPLSPHQAALDYQAYLEEVLKKHAKLQEVSLTAPANLEAKGPAGGAKGAKKPTTVLNFNVTAKGNIEELVKALEKMQSTPVTHRVKSLRLERAEPEPTDGKLTISMDIEAMIVHAISPDHRPKLSERADPPGTNPSRLYAQLGKRNMFVGWIPLPEVKEKEKGDEEITEPDPPTTLELRRYYYLEFTVPTSNQAWVRNHLAAVESPPMRLSMSAGFNTFRIRDEDGKKVLVDAKVLKITQRDVFFEAPDTTGRWIYAWHIGDSLERAMRRIASDDELRDAGLLPPEKKEVKK